MAGVYLVRMWGRDQDRVREMFPPGPNDASKQSVLNYWFETPEARKQFLDSLPKGIFVVQICVDPGPSDDDEELIDTLADTIAHVTLRLPDGREFSFEESFGFGYPEHAVHYTWKDGNYSCDCNKRLFLARNCGEGNEDDDIECGDTIELVSLTVEKRRLPNG